MTADQSTREEIRNQFERYWNGLFTGGDITLVATRQLWHCAWRTAEKSLSGGCDAEFIWTWFTLGIFGWTNEVSRDKAYEVWRAAWRTCEARQQTEVTNGSEV